MPAVRSNAKGGGEENAPASADGPPQRAMRRETQGSPVLAVDGSKPTNPVARKRNGRRAPNSSSRREAKASLKNPGANEAKGVRSRSFGWQKSIGSIAAPIGGVTFGKPCIASTTGDLARRKPSQSHYWRERWRKASEPVRGLAKNLYEDTQDSIRARKRFGRPTLGACEFGGLRTVGPRAYEDTDTMEGVPGRMFVLFSPGGRAAIPARQVNPQRAPQGKRSGSWRSVGADVSGAYERHGNVRGRGAFGEGSLSAARGRRRARGVRTRDTQAQYAGPGIARGKTAKACCRRPSTPRGER